MSHCHVLDRYLLKDERDGVGEGIGCRFGLVVDA